MIYLDIVDNTVRHVRHQPPKDLEGWIEWDGVAFAGDIWDGETVVPAPLPGTAPEGLREAAYLTRPQFHLALLDREILTPSDAARAARREWPVVLEPMLADLPEQLAARYQIVWATSETIHRMHPLLLEAAKPDNLGITDAELDDMFGI